MGNSALSRQHTISENKDYPPKPQISLPLHESVRVCRHDTHRVRCTLLRARDKHGTGTGEKDEEEETNEKEEVKGKVDRRPGAAGPKGMG